MITKRDFILRGSCFCEKFRWQVHRTPNEGKELTLDEYILHFISFHLELMKVLTI